MSKTLDVTLNQYRAVTMAPELYMYDSDVTLHVIMDTSALPSSFEVHYSVSDTDGHDSYMRTPTVVSDGFTCPVPNGVLCKGRNIGDGGKLYFAYAYLYEYDENGGYTWHKIIMPVIRRPSLGGAGGDDTQQIEEMIRNMETTAFHVAISSTEPDDGWARMWINPDEEETYDIPQIDDTTTSEDDTWSSSKIASLFLKAGLSQADLI